MLFNLKLGLACILAWGTWVFFHPAHRDARPDFGWAASWAQGKPLPVSTPAGQSLDRDGLLHCSPAVQK